MNKQLIKKYKAEFDHWLDGGKLQAKFVNDPWEEAPENIFSYLIVNFILVIDDEYVEFRKALAEGKVVQEQDYYTKEWIDMKSDNFHSASDTQYEGVYRIKPEEPKFKVGDWVVNKTSKQRIVKKITSICGDSVTVGNTEVGINVMLINDLELWQPKPDEWCWYSKWDKIVCVESYLCKYALDMNEVEPEYKHKYEPFIGQLPSYLKE